jgi:hypothetical protein
MYRVGQPGQFSERPRLRPILELVHTANFPVYGFVDHPFNLSIYSYGEGWFGQERNLYNITLTFSSPQYPEERDNFEMISSDAAVENQEGSGIIYTLRDSVDPTRLFRRYRLTQEEQAQIGTPFIWKGELSITGDVFSTKILSWSRPRQFSLFLLKSQKAVLSGHASGPSYEELLQLLQGTQVINHRDDLLKQYQYEVDQHRA